MSYTWAQLKEYTSVAVVANWTEDKALLYQSTAETILASLDLDTTVAGYTSAYNQAVILLFDWLAENPTGNKSRSMGKVSKNFSTDDLPGMVKKLLAKYMTGESGTFTGAKFTRKDIGLR
jgi:uncharacterized lipoprotein YmbA